MDKPTHKAIHICNSHQQTLHPKLQKSIALPTLASLWKEKPAPNNI